MEKYTTAFFRAVAENFGEDSLLLPIINRKKLKNSFRVSKRTESKINQWHRNHNRNKSSEL